MTGPLAERACRANVRPWARDALVDCGKQVEARTPAGNCCGLAHQGKKAVFALHLPPQSIFS